MFKHFFASHRTEMKVPSDFSFFVQLYTCIQPLFVREQVHKMSKYYTCTLNNIHICEQLQLQYLQ